MTLRTPVRGAAAGLALALALFLSAAASGDQAPVQSKKKPALLLRANPTIAFAPAKVQFQAILEGGDDNYEEYYCAAIEWEWDDDTVSESTPDCEPYEAERSHITRRYSSVHVFREDGRYEVKFKLKRKDDVLALTSISIQIGS